MANEVELARLDNWNELIRLGQIVVPALITGIAGFLGGWWQHKRRMKTLEDTREFSARELLFNFRKEQYNERRKSADNFELSLSKIFCELPAILITDNPPKELLDFANSLINEATKTLLHNIKDAHTFYYNSPHYAEYEGKFEWYKKALRRMLETEINFEVNSLMVDYSFVREVFTELNDFEGKVFKDELTHTVEKYVK